jgi:hypothetical protein
MQLEGQLKEPPMRILGFLAGWACLIGALAPTLADELRVGAAAVDITPPLGIPMAGYYHERGADGVLDPLYSKALVIESDGQRIALVALDIISVTRGVTDRAREEIEKATDIKADHVMISATHAHTGPELASRGRRSADMGGQQQATLQYTEALPHRIAETVRLASERLQPASLSIAKGRCENLAFNRRFFMRDGSVGWNPGKLNPEIVMPAGPTDPEVGVLYIDFRDAKGPVSCATYVNFAMHPDTTGGSKFSADWPGALSRVLASYHGPNHLTLLANGACGNINHIDVSCKWPGGLEQNRIGAILGASVFQAYKSLRPVKAGPLRARSETVELALPEITAQQLEEARQTIQATKDDRGANFMKLVRSYRALDVAAREGKPHRVELQVLALGREAAWVALPGEVFVELGLAIKKRSPFEHTFVIELANESIGYIPDRRSYAEDNYEPESARCAPGSGEKLVDAAAKLLADMYQ